MCSSRLQQLISLYLISKPPTMSAIVESLLLYPFQLSFEAVAPCALVVLCICVVGLSFTFANGIVYTCTLEASGAFRTSSSGQAQHQQNNVDLRQNKYKTVLSRIGIVSVILIVVGIMMMLGTKLTQNEWIKENIIFRLLICLFSTSSLLAELPGTSMCLHWSKN